jgi:hypothetical protein
MRLEVSKKQAFLLIQIINNAQHQGLTMSASLISILDKKPEFRKVLKDWNSETIDEFVEFQELKRHIIVMLTNTNE